MKNGSFTIMLIQVERKRPWGKRNEPSLATPKVFFQRRSSFKEGHALCLVGLKRDLVLWAFTKQTINSEVLFPIRRIEDNNWTKRPEIANRKGVVSHQDNAWPHVSLITRQKLLELGWNVLPHPPYSSDFAPSDFHLFRSLQNSLNGKSFNSR